MKVNVLSQQFNTETFERIGEMRTEEINTQTNQLFQDCKNIMDVRRRYESFWNDMGKNKNTPIKVLVNCVQRIEK
jgi:hypothetical protein